jgi:hypothetical protein
MAMAIAMQEQPNVKPEKLLDAMSPGEASLLLYLESRAVDQGGGVDTSHMNDDDMKIAKEWHNNQFIQFRRVLARWLDTSRLTRSSYCVRLSDLAAQCAALERRRRAIRSEREYVKASIDRRAQADDPECSSGSPTTSKP